MAFRTLAVSLGLLTAMTFHFPASAQDEAGKTKEEPTKGKADEKPKIAKATFGGGCFWCTEAVFERIPGVKSVVSGYAGGSVPNPTYQMVCSGLTGHAEVIQIQFDPKVVSYEKLLQMFWESHDPTTLNAQGDDFGTNYRSIILYTDEDQKKAAQKSYQEEKAKKKYKNRQIVTELVPLTVFYPAEDYHQDYFTNNRGNLYSDTHIEPKLRKLKLNKVPQQSR